MAITVVAGLRAWSRFFGVTLRERSMTSLEACDEADQAMKYLFSIFNQRDKSGVSGVSGVLPSHLLHGAVSRIIVVTRQILETTVTIMGSMPPYPFNRSPLVYLTTTPFPDW